MKKLFVFLFCVVAGLFDHNALSAQATVVRFLVELPGQGISQDSTVYIAGSFNGWNPKDENYRMKREDSSHYKLEVPCFANTNYEYKYTLGGWEHVEKTSEGKETDNRKITSRKKLKIKDKVVAWNAPSPKKNEQNPIAGMLSKEQIQQMMQMKDSITKKLAPAIPQLMGILQKVNMNLLADIPDPELGKQYNAEVVGVVSQILESLTNTLMKTMDVLTPEQKQKIREVMKNSTNPGDLINMITNSKDSSNEK